ncbi:ABC transporter ATP-binding protein, partial [Nanoarchaeota archaeon]
FKYNFGVYWGFLKKHKFMVFAVLFMVLLQQLKSLTDKYLFKVVIDKGTEFSVGTLIASEFIDILIIICIIFVSTSIFLVIIDWLKFHLVNRIDSSLILELKRKFFNHLLRLDHNFHTTHKTGSLISRLIRGGGAMERMTDIIVFNFLTLIFQLVVVSLSLIYLNWISAVVIFVTIIVFVSYSVFIQKIQQHALLNEIKQEDIEKANISDFFTNIDSIKYFGEEGAIQKRFFKLTSKTKKASIKSGDYWRWLSAGQSFILAMGVFFIIYFPLMNFLEGEITIGTLAFIYMVFGSIIGHMFGFVSGIRGFYRSMADFQPLFEYGKLDNEIKDKPGAKDLEIRKGIVEFKNVDFNYGKRKLLKNFNLKIKDNEKVALVGHSGCGKTTLIKLLNRFYDVNKGKVLIDEKDIRDFNQESIRSETGIVPQECVLFDDSIFNNIRFANLKASKEQVMKAIRFAQLDRIIKTFPKKENTIVGERGVKLSGGEKQRVSIARAILANKKVLVLDEATSSLDSETEHEIQLALAKLLEGRTSIIIAHRLSTIMNADRIIVMKNGKIIQQGKHSELIKQMGEYNKLWNLQKGGYIK